MRRWLLKSEPDAFSWSQQVRNVVEPWTGVRSHEARRHLAAMAVGDEGLFYHSNTGREIVGTVTVVRAAYPDPTANADEPWLAVDVRAAAPLARPVTLARIKADPAFTSFLLVRRARLSVLPVPDELWERIMLMGGGADEDDENNKARPRTTPRRKRAEHGTDR